jgi:hypothetical protein
MMLSASIAYVELQSDVDPGQDVAVLGAHEECVEVSVLVTWLERLEDGVATDAGEA